MFGLIVDDDSQKKRKRIKAAIIDSSSEEGKNTCATVRSAFLFKKILVLYVEWCKKGNKKSFKYQ